MSTIRAATSWQAPACTCPGGSSGGAAASPSFAPGTLTVEGNYAQSGGTLTEVIGGTGASQAGLIDVLGGAIPLSAGTLDVPGAAVTLSGGTLVADFANGFSPTLGETFTVMSFTAGDLSGEFGALAYHNGSTTVTGDSSRVNIGNGLALEALYNNGLGIS